MFCIGFSQFGSVARKQEDPRSDGSGLKTATQHISLLLELQDTGFTSRSPDAGTNREGAGVRFSSLAPPQAQLLSRLQQ